MGIIFLGAAFEEQVQRATQGQWSAREVLIGLTIALVVGFAIVLWVYLRSRSKSTTQDRERLSAILRAQSSERAERREPDDEAGDGVRRRKRRRRRDHRPRNPPLSQTGGLPPPRPDDQLPKY